MNTPKTRGYDTTKHSALPYVDKQFKSLLDQLAEKTGRTKKKALEMAITDAAITNNISYKST